MGKKEMQHISYSSISKYLKCPKSWEYHYIQKLKSPPKVPLFLGSLYHDIIAYLYGQKMAGEKIEDNDLDSVMVSFWKSKLPPGLDWKGYDQKEARIRLRKVIYGYRDKTMPFYAPIAIERKYTAVFEGIELLAYLDLVATKRVTLADEEGQEVIVDHKWRKNSIYENALLNDLQSTFYIMLSGVQLMEFHEALNQATPKVRVRPVNRDNDDMEFLKRIIHDVLNAVEKEVFPCNPLQNLCSPLYCEFYTECRMGWLK